MWNQLHLKVGFELNLYFKYLMQSFSYYYTNLYMNRFSLKQLQSTSYLANQVTGKFRVPVGSRKQYWYRKITGIPEKPFLKRNSLHLQEQELRYMTSWLNNPLSSNLKPSTVSFPYVIMCIRTAVQTTLSIVIYYHRYLKLPLQENKGHKVIKASHSRAVHTTSQVLSVANQCPQDSCRK